MFRLSSRLPNILFQRRYATLFSYEFKNLPSKTLPELYNSVASSGINQSSMMNLDVFVKQENNQQMDIVGLLQKFRKQKESTAAPIFPGIFVQQILDSATPQELVTIMRSPLEYGIFIDQYTGCYLIDHLLLSGNNLEAAQIASLLVERDLCTNELILAICYKAFYALLKDYTPHNPTTDKDDSMPEVEKVRVKFLRNYTPVDPNENTEDKVLGRAIIRLCESNKGSNELSNNFKLVGFALCGRFSELQKLITESQDSLYAEIMQSSLTIIEKQKDAEGAITSIKEAIKTSSRNNSLNEVLNSTVISCVSKHEAQLMTEYVNKFKQWATIYDKAINEQLEKQEMSARVEQINNILSELQVRRQKLWFFEKKDEIDIEIFKKKVYYPKRWFGKKKKPKAVDTFYIPPTITRNS